MDSLHIVKCIEDGEAYYWNASTLWSAAKGGRPVELEITYFESDFNKDLWFQNYKQPTIDNVYLHIIRVIKADLDFPVIISPKGTLLDGMHRLLKARLLGYKRINAIVLSNYPPSDYLDDEVIQNSSA